MTPLAFEKSRHHDAIAFLLGRIDYERAMTIPYAQREFRLERMRELLVRLGNPHDRLKIVHVAGTKGKGSTSAMLASILSAAGYRTGLYTSPHLDRLEERVMVDGIPCSAAEFSNLVDRLRPIVEDMDRQFAQHVPPETGPTYFEIITAIAMLHFTAMEVDAAILEVGLGGRLDSTNVCKPLVSVITSISFDHMQQLGNTLTAIAAEKAGIIKPGVPIVSGVTEAEPRDVIAAIASKCGSKLIQLGDNFEFRYKPPRNLDCNSAIQSANVDFHDCRNGRQLIGLTLGLIGRHQAANAAVAIATINELQAVGWHVPDTAIRQGLADARSPARVEIVAHEPTVVIDAAHNVASVTSLLETINESFAATRRILIFATTQEKDICGMLQLLLPQFETVIFTRYSTNPRSVAVEELESLAAELSAGKRHICPDPASAWKMAQELATPEHLICITGSFYLAAEMRAAIL